MEIIAWVQAHWADITQIVLAVIGAASVIVKLTPTLKDDNVLLSIIKFLSKYIALNVNTPTARPQ